MASNGSTVTVIYSRQVKLSGVGMTASVAAPFTTTRSGLSPTSVIRIFSLGSADPALASNHTFASCLLETASSTIRSTNSAAHQNAKRNIQACLSRLVSETFDFNPPTNQVATSAPNLAIGDQYYLRNSRFQFRIGSECPQTGS